MNENLWLKKPHYVIDTELNRLYDSSIPKKVPRAGDWNAQFPYTLANNERQRRSVAITEIGIIDKTKGVIKNVIVDNIATPNDGEFIPDQGIDVNIVYKGNKVSAKAYTRPIDSREAIKETLKDVSRREREVYMEKILPAYLDQKSARNASLFYRIGDNKNGATVGDFSLNYMKASSAKTEEQVAKYISKKAGMRISSKVLSQDLLYGKFIGPFVQALINRAKDGKASVIAAQNPDIEMKAIISAIYEYGSDYEKEQIEHLIRTNKVQFVAAEEGAVNIMYALAKEDSSLMSKFKIPVRPDVAARHMSRIGMTPSTFEEFAATATHSQEFLSSLVGSWYKPVSNLLEGGMPHSATPDTMVTDKLASLWREIEEKVREIAERRNILVEGSMVEFIERQSADNKTLFGEALREVMHDSQNSEIRKNAGAVKKQFENFVNTISKQASKRAAGDLKVIAAARKNGLGGFNSGGGRSFLPSKLKWSYGALGAVVGLTIASTYLAGGDDDEVGAGDPFGRHNLGKKPVNVKKTYIDEDIGEGPYYNSTFFTAALPAMGMIAGKFALIGLKQAHLQGNLLGVTGKNTPKEALSISQNVKNILSLIRLGIKDIESTYPMLRVLKAGQLWDYMQGSKNYGLHTSSKGKEVWKGVRHEVYNKLTNKHRGKTNIDTFMEAINIANPELAESLNQHLSTIPDRNVPLAKSTILISRTEDGRAYVAVEDLDVKGNFAKGWQGTFDVKPTFVSTSSYNLEARYVHPKLRKTNSHYHRLKSGLATDYGVNTQTALGIMTEKTFPQYLAQFDTPDFMSGPIRKNVWKAGKYLKWKLALDSKGINEASNLLYNTESPMTGVKTIVGVKGLTGDQAFTLDDLKYRNQFFGGIGREFVSAANRFLESPFETLFVDPTTITKTVNKLKSSKSAVRQMAGRALGFIEHPHLGLNVNAMKYGLPQYALELGLKRLLPIGVGFYGLGAIDRMMGSMTFSENGRGPIANGVIGAYEKAALAYTKLSDLTGLTTLAKKQEQAAPGSTGLGFFALPASMLATYGTLRFLHRVAPAHTKEQFSKFTRAVNSASSKEYPLNSLIGNLAERIGSSELYKTAMRREAFSGALNKPLLARGVSSLLNTPKKAIFAIGMAAMSPFLPGLLGSTKTYAERKAEFEGKKDVAIRKNRGWLLSSQPFVGEKVTQYRQHALSLIKSNWENKGVVWESYKARLLHGATLGLWNRYALEEYHAQAQPVYESAPYGATIPILGPLISQTVGRVIKPIRTYHTSEDEVRMPDTSRLYREIATRSQELGGSGDAPIQPKNPVADTGFTAEYARSGNIPSAAGLQFMRQLNDVVGFKGFMIESMMQYITGKDSGDQFTPYMQSAKQMYNPSQYMWQYQAGDVSLVGGEFLRRIFVAPEKKWEINNLPNELFGQSWIPERLWTGTTFDKMSMGWLYASRKGWEFQHPELKGKRLEDYPDHLKLDILKYMAPKSREFEEASKLALQQALSNRLTPYQEQRAYEAVAQRQELMRKLNAHAAYNTYTLDMEETDAEITGLDIESGTFSTNKSGNLRIAGVSTNLSDIRASLVRKQKFGSAEELDEKSREIQANVIEQIQSMMAVGNKITYSTPSGGSYSGKGKEAIVDGLNDKLLDMGAPLIDTGNVSLFNLQKSQQSIASGITSKYWNALTDHNSFFMKKLIGDRDYLTEYKSNRVFNKEVRMWTKPIEHFLKPMTASLLSNFGMEITPSFTKRRRHLEQYWDVVKYIKYKTLATESARSNNIDEAKYYEQLSRETMVGADPINNPRDAEKGLPFGEKDYFEYFSNEPDPKKRGQIEKYLPATAKRIYEAIWVAKEVNSGAASQEQIEQYEKLRMTGGYDVDEDFIEEWRADTGGEMPLPDYARARFVSEYAKDHDLPDIGWAGFSKQVNIENVELLALKEAGEQVQDYGYFENQIRTAAYDKLAYISAQQMDSRNMTDSQFNGTVLPNLVSTSGLDTSNGLPTSSSYPVSNNTLASNSFDKGIYTKHNIPAFASSLINETFLFGLNFIR